MKKYLTFLLLLVIAAAFAMPVFADDNRNQIAQVLEISQGAVEESVMKTNHLQEAELMRILRQFQETEESKEVLPEDMEINHLTMIRQRDVSNNGEPIEISLRAWGAAKSWYLLVLFKPLGEETWTILSAAQGQFIDAVLPGDGQYALAWSWG